MVRLARDAQDEGEAAQRGEGETVNTQHGNDIMTERASEEDMGGGPPTALPTQ